MTEDRTAPFRPITKMATKKTPPRRQVKKWIALRQVPDDASAPPKSHYKHGVPSLVHAYRGVQNELLGYVCRFELSGNGKLFCPLTWCRNETSGECNWRWKAWAAPRPLYGLDRLASDPDAPVIICEGEKAADAAVELLPNYVSVTSPNGSQSAAKADWAPLEGRDVVIWPDSDEPGHRYANDVAAALFRAGTRRIEIISPPEDVEAGWDAADALRDGWTSESALALVQSASEWSGGPEPNETTPEDSEEAQSNGHRGARLRNSLLELMEDCELWHDEERSAFATVPIKLHREHLRIKSREFDIWFSGAAYRRLQEPVGEQAMRDAVRLLEARAIYDGQQYTTFLRIGGDEGQIFLDLGDPDWTIIGIDGNGWRVVEECKLKSVRASHMEALPMPQRGELLETYLRPLVNVADERDFRLIVAWLICAFRDIGEYPILSINGEQGSAKSTLARMVRQLIDPNKASNRAAPREERELAVAACNSRVISLDNLSGLPAWLSDTLCRIATGGGFSTRALHTDIDEVVINLENPIILNGIPEIAGRPDLTDRSYLVTLPTIRDAARKSSSQLWAEFEQNRPFILGALLDAVSAALRNLPNINLAAKPRMANAAEWVTAAESGLGWEPGTHIADLDANRRNAIETSVENEPVAIGIMEMDLPWTGTPSRLHEKLSDLVPGVPKTVNSLGNALVRITPVMAEMGIKIERRRGKERSVTIRRIAD